VVEEGLSNEKVTAHYCRIAKIYYGLALLMV
jgi:hypothetical protein